MIHDLDLLLDLVGGPVVEVSAVGAAVFGRHEDMANARLRFANGCVAHLTASRMSPNPKRKLRIWAPEGYAGIDFVQRRITLVQPSAELRRRGIPPARLEPAKRQQLQNQIFTRYLETLDLDCDQGDQLTRELDHFLTCVRTGATPRVSGEDGRDAIALATRVLDSMKPHLAFSVENQLSDDREAGQLKVVLNFKSLEDFEPENVAKQVKPLKELLDLRTRLSDLRGSLQTNEKLDELLLDAVSNTDKLNKLKGELGIEGKKDGGSNG